MPLLTQTGYARNERIYLMFEQIFGVTPNTSGSSNLTGANCASHISCTLDPDVDTLEPTYKTGSRGQVPGQAGRKIGHFSLQLPVKGSGVPGVPSDYSPLLNSMFGQMIISNGASTLYKIVDDPAYTFSLFRFRQPGTLYQQVGISCVVTRVTWNVGQNMADWTVEGDCFWVLDSEQFNNADSFARGGLTTFPSEPANPVTNGVQTAGFVGNVNIGGAPLSRLQQMTVVVNWGWSQNRFTFGSYYSTDVLGAPRTVQVTIDSFDDSSSVLQALRAVGISKSTINIQATLGNVPGNMHTWNIRNCQLPFPQMTESQNLFSQRFTQITAHESVPGAKDEIDFTES